jgi:chemotaxis protein MotA
MDIITTLGLVIAWASLIGSVVIEGIEGGSGVNVSMFVKMGPILLVFGGTFGAAMIGLTKEEVMAIPSHIKKAFFNSGANCPDIIKMLVNISRQVRRDGLLVLEKQTKSITNEFMRKGVQLLVDGVDMNHIRLIMETDIIFLKQRHAESQDFFSKLGGFSPTLGIIGTVMGLVNMLSNLSDPSTMGPAIASAFIATLYGVSMANLVYLPIANKLKKISANEVIERRIMLEGLLSIQAGDNPRIIEERLLSFIAPKQRDEGRSKKGAAAKEAK